MQIIRTVPELRAAIAQWRERGEKISLVPTMGALHEGHLALVKEGLNHATRAIATIFVNPRQFAAHEDLSRYPRDEQGDLEKLRAAGASAVFLPDAEVMYPAEFATTVHMSGPATAGLEDKFRPHFFDGVATVVAKLFILADADFAIFGEKDYQQLLVVRRMAKDLNIQTEVFGLPTIREADGLAMSSRNRYLSTQERQQATEIHRALSQAAVAIRGGKAPALASRAAKRALTKAGFRVDYVAARNGQTLGLPQGAGEPLRLLAAAWLGKTRLIDNIPV